MRRKNRSLSALGLVLATGLVAGPANAALYKLDALIPVPPSAVNSQGGKFNSFDISYFDGSTQLDYIADRSNASVDVFSAATNSFVTRIGGFVGQAATTSVSGPDGVVTVNLPGQHQLWAGDGNSTLKGFDISSAYAPLAGTPVSTGGTHRVDEMSFDPKDNILAVANNADTPAFVTLVNAKTSAVVAKITFDGTGGTPNATDGIEQSVWNPATNSFFISIPTINGGSNPGGIAEMDATGKILKVFDFASFGISACSPAGIALGTGSRLMVGCNKKGTQAVLFDPTANSGNGAVLDTYSQINGSDEVWFDPTTDRWFISGGNNASGPAFGVVDGLTDTFLQDVATVPGNTHSIAVDPVSGEVFVPFPGLAGNTVCPSGCIAVYSTPEPGTLPLMLSAIAVMGGLAIWRRRAH